MPITDNEIYKFNYDPKNRGVVLEFSPKPRERITWEWEYMEGTHSCSDYFEEDNSLKILILDYESV